MKWSHLVIIKVWSDQFLLLMYYRRSLQHCYLTVECNALGRLCFSAYVSCSKIWLNCRQELQDERGLVLTEIFHLLVWYWHYFLSTSVLSLSVIHFCVYYSYKSNVFSNWWFWWFVHQTQFIRCMFPAGVYIYIYIHLHTIYKYINMYIVNG